MIEEANEQRFRQRESDLLGRVQSSQLSFRSDHARRHMREGFARRLLLMQTNRLTMIEIAPLGRSEKLSTYECADLNVHVNSWYVQMRGALDNLSWALHYEWNLLGTGSEDDVKTRRSCYLFTDQFRSAATTKLSVVPAAIEAHVIWAANFKELRDPIAHRVPMYAVPGVASDDDRKQFERLNAEANEAAKLGDFDTFRDKTWEAQRVGTYFHVVAMSGTGGIELRRLPPQLTEDFEVFLSIADAVVGEFELKTA